MSDEVLDDVSRIWLLAEVERLKDRCGDELGLGRPTPVDRGLAAPECRGKLLDAQVRQPVRLDFRAHGGEHSGGELGVERPPLRCGLRHDRSLSRPNLFTQHNVSF